MYKDVYTNENEEEINYIERDIKSDDFSCKLRIPPFSSQLYSINVEK